MKRTSAPTSTTAAVLRPNRQQRQRGPGTAGGNGGNLQPPWPKGVSGNPSGRPSTKPITEAYNRILDLPAVALGKFVPRTQAEMVAWAMIRRACSMAHKLGVAAAKEVTDRVEGGSPKTEPDRQTPLNVTILFSPRGTIVETTKLEEE